MIKVSDKAAEKERLSEYYSLGHNFRERERVSRKQKRWVKKLKVMAPQERRAMLAVLNAPILPTHGEKIFELENYTFVSSDITRNVLIRREHPKMEFEVPFRYLLKFVASYVAEQRVAEIKEAHYEEILGIKKAY